MKDHIHPKDFDKLVWQRLTATNLSGPEVRAIQKLVSDAAEGAFAKARAYDKIMNKIREDEAKVRIVTCECGKQKLGREYIGFVVDEEDDHE